MNIEQWPQPESELEDMPISEHIQRWKIVFESMDENLDDLDNKIFFQVYVASKNQKKLDEFLEYVCTELQVDASDIQTITADSHKQDITLELDNAREAIQKISGDTVIILVKNFENVVKERLRIAEGYAMDRIHGMSRLGHDFNQNIAENRELTDDFRKIRKKIIIITPISNRISNRQGDDLYEESVKTALQSQFRDDFIEIKENTKI